MNDLWCLHVLGPDDVLPAPNKEAAEQAASRLNDWWNLREKHPLDPELRFVVEPWAGTQESHARYAETWDDRIGAFPSPKLSESPK